MPLTIVDLPVSDFFPARVMVSLANEVPTPPVSPLSGTRLLITGGTGSFGTAFARHALDAGAAWVGLYARDEAKHAEAARRLNDPRVRPLVGDVRDAVRLWWAVKGCDIVVHAAAMKRIETCEAHPWEAVATNVTGSLNVAEACIRAGVARAVFLSTDKAPAPHTLYGATKLTAERCWIQSNVYAAGTATKLSATRYGNVLGSRGSVLHLWREQVSKGEPVTVTDARMTRFWMTLNDAVQLVCTALREMRGGEVFVPKTGASKITELAKAVGAERWVETGLRPGERLHETLISAEESRHTWDAGGHYVIEPESPTWRASALRVLRDPIWSYQSDTNPQQLTAEDLRRMAA